MKDFLKEGKIITIDTPLWIYHFENHPRFSPLTAEILKEVNSGRCPGVISELTLLEILIRPLRMDLQDVADEYEILLENFPNLEIVPISRPILLKAAFLRAKYGLKTPDAIIIATGILHRASFFITNDKRWKAVEEIDVVCLNELSTP